MVTKRTPLYVSLATAQRVARRLTTSADVDAVIDAGMTALGADPAWSWGRDQQDAVVIAHGYDKQFDLNGEGVVNSGDQGLAVAFGVPATLPPPPTSNTLQIILDDMTLPHDGAICGVAGYDWEKHAAIQRAQSGGITQATGWGVAQHGCGGPQNYSGRVQVRNRQTWLWNGTSYTKIQDVGTAIGWHDTMNTQTNQFVSPKGDWREEGGGVYSFTIPADSSLHWAGNNVNIPNGNYWIIVTCEYRLVGGDIANANVIAGAGADWRNPGPVGAVVGRYHRLTADWQLVTATTFRPTVAPV